ncbi:hypothetical protein [Bradyrhizobium genosp. P]|uniref:hypothetical protein n=1 Tax=Bradyrhizobium genosp. P TaxID=83641 RepID=UPI003CF3903C
MNTHPLGDPVPAVGEGNAKGEIAAIFADIRTSLGTSSVNLIWRHLAMFPGALSWCWRTIAPLHQRSELGDAARDFRRELTGPTLPQLPPEVLHILEIEAKDIALISSTLRGYQMSCTMNILSLNALLLLLKDSAHGALPGTTPKQVETHAVAPPLQKMARLLNPEEMPPPVAELAWRLNSLCTPGDPILASLYRYLANWPSFLALTWSLIAPMEADGRLPMAIERTLTAADARAKALLPFLTPPTEAMDSAVRDIVCKALEDFARGAIVKIIPITQALMTAVG